MTRVLPIDRFTGPYSFLSNFHPINVLLDGEVYPSVEHAYQAAKTDVPEGRDLIRRTKSAGQAKRTGRLVRLRAEWDGIKEDVMRLLLIQKFGTANPLLRQALVDTGEAELIERNWWRDTYWGVCDGHGRNRLGVLLMDLRAAIQEGRA